MTNKEVCDKINRHRMAMQFLRAIAPIEEPVLGEHIYVYVHDDGVNSVLATLFMMGCVREESPGASCKYKIISGNYTIAIVYDGYITILTPRLGELFLEQETHEGWN